MQHASSPLNALYVWDKMQEIFGNAWSNQYTNSPNSTWIEALSTLTETDINRGLNTLLKSRSKYAPNLVTFLGMCELIDDRTPEQRAFDARCKEFESARALPKPPSNPEARRLAFAEMKKMLSGA